MTTETLDSELTIILTAHNRETLVEGALASLAEQRWDGTWDIVLVDNDSSDNTLQILERWVDKMPVPTTVVHAADEHNLCYARNVGVEHSEASAISFLDDDDMLGAGFVAAIGSSLRTQQFAGARHEHRVLNDETAAKYRGTFQTNELGEMFGTPMVSGGGFACHRDLWIDLGGQRESFGYGGEDFDFSLRAAERGVVPAFVEDAVYHVRLRSGLRASFTQGRRFGSGRVRLYSEYGQAFDEQPASLAATVRAWAGLVRRLPNLRHDEPRLVWAWQFGRRLGHLQGSITERRWYP